MKSMLLLVLLVSVGTFGTPVSNRELCTPKDLDSAMRNFAWTLISKSFPKGSMNIHCRNNHILKISLYLINLLTLDCNTCYSDSVLAVEHCMNANETWFHCIQDVLGLTNPCTHCICDIIMDH